MNDEPGNQVTGESDTPDSQGETSIPKAAEETVQTPAVDDASAETRPEPSAHGEAPEVAVTEPEPANEETPAAGESEASDSKVDPAREKPGRATGKPRRKPRNTALARAYRTGQPVEGTIVQVIKGGYEIKIGQSRGFCPHSQVDIHREEDPESKVGQTHQFRIMQLRRGGEDVVLSRRALLEEGRLEEAKAVRATLLEDAVMQGHVVGTAKFGAFVDLGAGVQGLVHISELAHQRVQTVEEAVRPGDVVRVKILKLHEDTGRISLSIRQAVDDPWAGVAEKFEAGQTYPGTVRRVADFGAFVELANGVEGLAPASEFPPSTGGWNEGLDTGVEREWMVLSVDPRARRISVTLPGDAPGVVGDLAVGAELEGKIQRIERYGVFVWLGPGRVGLLPRAWTGTGESVDLRRHFGIGDPVEVSVVEVSEDGRRIRLAKKGVKIEPEKERREQSGSRKDLEAHQAAEDPGTFGTSLADKLRAALGRSENE